MIYIISTIIVLGVLVTVHELGHFLAAKLVGIRVDTFSIGYPPRMFSRKYGETDYQIGWIPLGGYVKMSGMIDESFDTEFANQKPEPWEYRSKKAWQKVFVSGAGVLMNLLLTVIIYFGLTLHNGIPYMADEPVVHTLSDGFPAQKAGMLEGDRIVEVNGHKIGTWEQMTNIVHALPETDLTVKVQRESDELTFNMKSVAYKTVSEGSIKTIGLIGIGGKMEVRPAGVVESAKNGFVQTYYWLKLTVSSLYMMVTGEESLKNVGGPIMIAQMAGESAKNGASSLLAFIAIISVNLAFINILPIPALDGGHIIVAIAEGITRREISTRIKLIIQQIGAAILLSLIVLVIFNDITRLFN